MRIKGIEDEILNAFFALNRHKIKQTLITYPEVIYYDMPF